MLFKYIVSILKVNAIFSQMKSVETQSEIQVTNLELNVDELNKKNTEIIDEISFHFEFNNNIKEYVMCEFKNFKINIFINVF